MKKIKIKIAGNKVYICRKRKWVEAGEVLEPTAGMKAKKLVTKVDYSTRLKGQNIIIHPGTESKGSGVISVQMYHEIMMEMCGRVDERPKNDFVTIEAVKKMIEEQHGAAQYNNIKY